MGMKYNLNYDYKRNALSDKINIGTKQCIKLKNQIY